MTKPNDIHPSSPSSGYGDGIIWLNWGEFMKLSRRLSDEQMGGVIIEILEASRAGLLRNGKLARKDRPPSGGIKLEREAADG